MKRFDMRIVLGSVLIIGGGMLLLQNLGIFYGGVDLVWAVLIGGAGVASLYIYTNDHEKWWALIPGITLVAIALNIVLDVISPRLSNTFGSGIILGGIGLSFWLVYLNRRSFWWAVIPAGVLGSLAVVSIVEEFFPAGQVDGLFLVGLGLTFLALPSLPNDKNKLRWALIPGGILTIIGVLTLPFMQITFNILFPLALIGAGGYVIYKNFKN